MNIYDLLLLCNIRIEVALLTLVGICIVFLIIILTIIKKRKEK
ncbi:MAG: hypothetical protein PUA90_03570 [bacterium]|nr:hypothetical protein [bacterium]